MGRAVIIAGYSMKKDFTINNLSHNVDVMLGMTKLQETDPLIHRNTRIVDIPDFISSFQRIVGQRLDK